MANNGQPGRPFAAAGFGVMAPWVTRRWRTAGWLTIAVFLMARSIDGTRAG